jgi:hypothetical protein
VVIITIINKQNNNNHNKNKNQNNKKPKQPQRPQQPLPPIRFPYVTAVQQFLTSVPLPLTKHFSFTVMSKTF